MTSNPQPHTKKQPQNLTRPQSGQKGKGQQGKRKTHIQTNVMRGSKHATTVLRHVGFNRILQPSMKDVPTPKITEKGSFRGIVTINKMAQSLY